VTPTAADEQLIGALVEFARAPSATKLSAIPFAERVKLGLSDRIVTERAASDLVRPEAWLLSTDVFRGRIGPFSSLVFLARATPTMVSVGQHPHCASSPVPPPAELASSRRLSIQPTGIDTCVLWWTVDVFLSPERRIQAITLDLWDP
jgi:hypothetical protein